MVGRSSWDVNARPTNKYGAGNQTRQILNFCEIANNVKGIGMLQVVEFCNQTEVREILQALKTF